MLKNKAKRILIFNVNWVGDVLFSTAVIRNVRYNFPEAFIACAIPPRCYAVLKDNPHLDEVIIYDEDDRHRRLTDKVRFISQLKARKFDTVFLLHRSLTRALIARLAGIKNRVGYHTKKRGFFLTKKIAPPAVSSMHRVDYYLNIIEQAGLKVEDRYCDFYFSDEDMKFAEQFLHGHGIKQGDLVVGINAGGNWGLKRWPKENWALLADRLIRDFKAKVVITGSPQDMALAREITGFMKEKPVLASGALNLKQLGALCKKLDYFITADTGPLHIANASGAKKIIALFGPTSPELTGPVPLRSTIILQKDSGCRVPCYVVDCKDNRCMKMITPEDVLEKIK